MAIITIDREEVEDLALPPICIRCGAPATVWKERGFDAHHHRPLFTFFLGWHPVQVVNEEQWRFYLRFPFCRLHQYHWQWRTFVIYGGYWVNLIAFIAVWFLPVDLLQIFLPWLYLFIGWCVTAWFASVLSIRQVGVEEGGITLRGVSDKFAMAFERGWPKADRHRPK